MLSSNKRRSSPLHNLQGKGHDVSYLKKAYNRHIDWIVQEKRNSSALAMELRFLAPTRRYLLSLFAKEAAGYHPVQIII